MSGTLAAAADFHFQTRLLDTVGQAIIVTDGAGVVTYWNRFASSLYGWTPEEVLGRPITATVVPPESLGVAGVIMERLNRGEVWSGEFTVRRRDGSCFPAFVTDTPVFGEAGELRAIIGISWDISAHKRADQAQRFLVDVSAALASVQDYGDTLRRVAELCVPRFADWCALDMIQDDGAARRLAVAHRDPAKVELVYRLQRLHPLPADSPHGMPQVLRTGEADFVAAITRDMAKEVALSQEHMDLLVALGIASYIGVPLRRGSRVIGVMNLVRVDASRRFDPSDLLVAEELARRAEAAIENARLYAELRRADRRKDEFLATLAHELRNPLAPIGNAIHVLGMPEADAATSRRMLEMMERQFSHLVRLVDDLMDVSRVMRGKIELRRERIDLGTIVARAVETVRGQLEAQQHQLTLSLPAEPLLLDADPVRLTQVIGNLLANAAKYTERKGHIHLTAERGNGDAVLRLHDDGIGIAPELLPHVFDLFVQGDNAATRAQGGLGIGLTLVKNIVEMHQGSVGVYSAGLHEGSEFVVRLPLVAAVAPDGPGAPGKARTDGAAGHRLLVVDDNVDAAQSLATLLQYLGNEAGVAHDGLSALDLAAELRPDLVFLDIGMPGMDGYGVARRLRQIPGLERIVLVALTGWGQDVDRRRSQEAGFDHHLVKPAELRQLEELLAALPASRR